MTQRQPLCYHFEIMSLPVGFGVKGRDLRLSMWTRENTPRMLKALMRHAALQARYRGLTPKRTGCVIEGTSLRCFVFTT